MRKLLVLLILVISSGLARGNDTLKPEFDGYCAYGLAHGGEIKTECDVVWISAEGKLYCFASEAGKADFLKDAQRSIRKAKAFWDDPSYWERLKKEEES
jgi:hypothetical protein